MRAQAPRTPPVPHVPPKRPQYRDLLAEFRRDIDDDVPDHVTFNDDPAAWYRFLTDMGCDEVSLGQLFHLGQSGPRGHLEAREIIWRLLQKLEACDAPRYPSRWMTSAVHDGRNKLVPLAAQQRDTGRYMLWEQLRDCARKHGVPVVRLLLCWWGRWRMIQAPQMARELIAAGWQPGPAIGEELRRQRSAAQDRSR